MVNIILASHGDFAKGIAQSGQMIFGEQKNFTPVVLEPSNGPEDLKKKIEKALKAFKNEDQTLFIVDLWSGTPFNVTSKIVAENEKTMALVAGMNLPMVVEALAARMGESDASKIATSIIAPGREGVRAYPESLDPKTAKTSNASSPAAGGAKKSGKKGNGIEVGLARIDSRLLHGQVATAWTKSVNPDRIIIVSDDVSKDELRKTLLTQAAPVGVKVNTIPISKLVEIWKDKKFDGLRVLFLFENPEDIVKAYEGGVKFDTVNVGSLAFTEGKTSINSVLAVNQNDVEAFEKLAKAGTKFDVRKVPSDSADNLDKLIKAKAEEIKKNSK